MYIKCIRNKCIRSMNYMHTIDTYRKWCGAMGCDYEKPENGRPYWDLFERETNEIKTMSKTVVQYLINRSLTI
jgi:hypothetical protein